VTFRLFLVFATLVGINVYVFFYSPGSLRMVAEAAKAAEVASIRGRPLPMPMMLESLRSSEGVLREREGLGAALRREGLAAADADGALRSLRPLLDFKRDLHARSRYTMQRTASGRLAVLELRAGGMIYAVHRAPDGRLLAGKGSPSKKGIGRR
jgi:hypothetical protein